jgi:hypothetical protein
MQATNITIKTRQGGEREPELGEEALEEGKGREKKVRRIYLNERNLRHHSNRPLG